MASGLTHVRAVGESLVAGLLATQQLSSLFLAGLHQHAGAVALITALVICANPPIVVNILGLNR